MSIQSTFYDTSPGVPATLVDEIKWANAHPAIGASEYGVEQPGDFALAAHPTTPFTVNLAPGKAWGRGVFDTSTEVESVTCTAPAAGTTRWDLIAFRRDWRPLTGGPSALVAVPGGTSKQLPAGRQNNPGTIDDQPLYLVEWKAGQTQPNTIADLRCWAGNGGMFAKDDLVRGYLARVGTEVTIGSTLWKYALGQNDMPGWVSGDPVAYAPLPVNGYALDGVITVEPAGTKRRVTVDINVTRTGPSGSIPADDYASFGAVLPTAARGSVYPKYLPVSILGGQYPPITATVFLNPSSGIMQIRGSSKFTWQTGALFSLNLAYYI